MAPGTTRMEKAPSLMMRAHETPAPPGDPKGHASSLCVGVGLLSGGLLWACYFPLALGSYLGWIALVPFLFLVRSQVKPRLLYDCAWVCGISFFFPTLYWMSVADLRMYATWTMLALYCSLYFPVALFLLRRLEPWRLPMTLTVPLVWVALEYVRSFLMTGFAWYFLAHTQHDVLPMIQITDLGGAYIVSFLVAAVNGFVFDCLYQFPGLRAWFRQSALQPIQYYSSLELLNRSFFSDWLFRRNLILEGSALAIVLTSSYAYGVYRLGQDRFVAGPLVCLLQSNLDQRIRDHADTSGEDSSEEAIGKHFAALNTRVVRDLSALPNLIIWPETSFPQPWCNVSLQYPIAKVPDLWRLREIDIRDRLQTLSMRTRRVPHLLGMNSYFLDEHGQPRHYNTAVLLNAKGQAEAHYDKMHRVPFGEYLPLKDWVPFMKLLSPYDHDYSVQPGERMTRFQVRNQNGENFHFGMLICYEDTDPFLARRYLEQSDDEPAVDFLVNISNDGWFAGSFEHEEHLAVCRFRAIECRRAMVRAVNMGISAVIDGNGRVLKPGEHPDGKPAVWVVRDEKGQFPDLPVSDWQRFKKVAGILTALVPIDQRFSFYALAGDWLPMSCWAILAAIGLRGVARRKPSVPRAA